MPAFFSSHRLESVNFLLWMLSSDVSKQIADDFGYALIPDLLQQDLGINTKLSSMSCLGVPIVPTSANAKLRVVGTSVLGQSTQLSLTLFSSLDSASRFEFTAAANPIALRQVYLAESDVAIITPQYLHDDILSQAFIPTSESEAYGELIMVPSFISASLPVFRLSDHARQLSLDLTGSLPHLALTLELLGGIFAGNITTITDPAILQLNPHLTLLYSDQDDAQLTVVVCCSHTADPRLMSPNYKTLLFTLNLTQSFGSAFLPKFPFDWNRVIESQPQARFIYVETEAVVGSIVRSTENSIGVIMKTRPEVDITSEIQFFPGDLQHTRSASTATAGVSLFSRLSRIAHHNTSDTFSYTQINPSAVFVPHDIAPITSTLDNMASCASDTTVQFSPGIVLTDVWLSNHLDCWPFSMPSSLVVRSSYTNIVSTALLNSDFQGSVEARSCSHGKQALALADFLLTSSTIAPISTNSGAVLLSSILSTDSTNIGAQFAVASASTALRSVTCDGETLLVVQPLIWKLPSGVIGAGKAMAAIGIILVILCAIIVFFFRNRTVFRSASPPFLFISLFGLLLLFISAILLVQSTPTASSCAGLMWTVYLGTCMSFSPLFMKTYRIWKIFGERRIKVVKISNKKLLILVSIIIATQILLLAIWQGIGPWQVVTISEEVPYGDATRTKLYTQCSIGQGNSSSTAMLIVNSLFVGGMLVWGARLALATRQVNSTFNESSQIAIALYNLIFTAAILALIVELVGAIGTSMHVLLLMALLWVALATLVLLFALKIFKLSQSPLTLESVHSNLGSKSQMSGAGSVADANGFSFLSLAGMPYELLKRCSSILPFIKSLTITYLSCTDIAALESQLAQARELAGKAQNDGKYMTQTASSNLVRRSSLSANQMQRLTTNVRQDRSQDRSHDLASTSRLIHPAPGTTAMHRTQSDGDLSIPGRLPSTRESASPPLVIPGDAPASFSSSST